MTGTWSVIVDYWYGQWTYGVYHDEDEAKQAKDRCSPIGGTVRIRRDE